MQRGMMMRRAAGDALTRAGQPQPQDQNQSPVGADTVGGGLGAIVGALAAGIPSGGAGAPQGALIGSQLGQAAGGFCGAESPEDQRRAAKSALAGVQSGLGASAKGRK